MAATQNGPIDLVAWRERKAVEDTPARCARCHQRPPDDGFRMCTPCALKGVTGPDPWAGSRHDGA